MTNDDGKSELLPLEVTWLWGVSDLKIKIYYGVLQSNSTTS